MSIEFGVLREGSTVTRIGEYRVSLPEELLVELKPLLHRVEEATGQELDPYGSATFLGPAIEQFIREIEATRRLLSSPDPQLEEFLSELLRVASFAYRSGRALSYFGQ